MSSIAYCRASTLFILPLLLFLAAQTARANVEEFPRGIIIEKVICQADSSQSYALYLPSNYTPGKKWPVIYAFDPSAEGRTPVELYREAAEKYGYVVAGSHNSQNGMQSEPLKAAISCLISDTRKRFSLDEKRIYTTGFSGGARVATRIASSCNGCVAGVIACGAGFPPDLPPKRNLPFAFYGTIGLEDYNFPELLNLDEKLDSLNAPHRIETFAGAHQWASAQLLTEAVEWMEVQAMRNGRSERKEPLIELLWQREIVRAQSFEAVPKLYEAYKSYAALVADFKGLKDVAAYEKKLQALRETKEVKQAIKDERGQVQKQLETAARIINLGSNLLAEPSQRGEVIKELREEIDGLRKKAQATEDSIERRMARRTLRQVFAQTFEAAMFNYHPNRQYQIAVANLEVATLIAPDHRMVAYEMARAYALSGEKKKAIESLKRAVEKGFNDTAAIERQKDFNVLRTEAEFTSIIKSIGERQK